MKRALIFSGVIIVSCCSFIFLLRGEQKRKHMDVEKIQEAAEIQPELVHLS